MRNQDASQFNDILIVDDEPINLRLLSMMLTKRGYHVRAELNAPQALKAAQAAPPDLILLDIMMPEMDGYGMCLRLKADERTRDIPVLFLSALTETEDKVKGFACGGLDYITKPFQPEEVMARIETQLKLRRFQREVRKQEEILRELLNASLDATYLVKTDGTILTLNEPGAKELGLPINESHGKCIWEYLPSEVAPKRKEQMEKVIQSGKPFRIEDEWKGRYLDIVIHPLFDDKGKVGQVAIYSRDVTERKRMVEELQRYSDNLRMLIQESPTPIIFIGYDEKIAIVNKSSENLLGYGSEELLGKSISTILSEGRSLEVADRINCPMCFVNKMGTDIPVAVSTSVQLFKDRKSGMQEKGLIVTLRDLSDIQGLSIAPMCEASTAAVANAARPVMEPGYIYLVEEERAIESVAAFRYLVEHGDQGLYISRQRAEKVKAVNHLEKTPHIWLTRSKTPTDNCIGPDELTKLHKTLENFLKRAEQGAIFFDGMEYLISQNGFNIVLKFIHSLNDSIMLGNSLAILVIDPMALDTKELHILRRETRSLDTIWEGTGICRVDQSLTA